jgi:hypothetical protein
MEPEGQGLWFAISAVEQGQENYFHLALFL